MAEKLRHLLISQEGVLFVIMLVSVLFLATRTDKFLTVDNLLQQGRFMTEVGLIAIPMTYIIITGGIDLSVGSILGLTAIVLGWTWQELGFPLELAIITGILSGTLAGFVNGLFIVRVGVPPLIMTLATLALYRGLAEGISEARSARGYPEWFFQLGQGEFLGIPTQLVAADRSGDRLRHCAGADAAGPRALRHRQQRAGRALQRADGQPALAFHLYLLRLHVRRGRLHICVARQHDPLRHGHGH